MSEPPADLETAVLWSYRLLLGREPESADVVRLHAQAHRSVEDIRRMFMRTDEFSGQVSAQGGRMPAADVLDRFPPWQGSGEPGYWIDFLGVRTRCAYLPDTYGVLSGCVEGPPGQERAPLHETAEWIGTLRSVLEAEPRGRLTAIELGAGWGPWLVGAAKAAGRIGIGEIHLVGVEGAESHMRFMLQHFADNGLDPARHHLLHGVAGPRDGVARFPRLADPRDDWGGVAEFEAPALPPEADAGFDEVRCYGLAGLIEPHDRVDLIHCDVQGAELDVLAAAMEPLNRRVRRLVIGTHARSIEAQLLDLFSAARWRLEDEGACRLIQDGASGALGLVRDGYQVWANPSLA